MALYSYGLGIAMPHIVPSRTVPGGGRTSGRVRQSRAVVAHRLQHFSYRPWGLWTSEGWVLYASAFYFSHVTCIIS